MYTCKCGKEFPKRQSYIAHCSHCKEHLGPEQQVRRAQLNAESANRAIEMSKIRSDRVHSEKYNFIKLWISEGHTCEQCGKVMTEYYGSGRFCGPHCSRSYSSKIAKENPDSMKAFSYGLNKDQVSPYEQIICELLKEQGISFIQNATRTQYTEVRTHGKGSNLYVLDFFLKDYSIDLEIDGRFHKDKVDHDSKRDTYLNSIGIKTYRIKLYDTDKTLENQFQDFIKWLNMECYPSG